MASNGWAAAPQTHWVKFSNANMYQFSINFCDEMTSYNISLPLYSSRGKVCAKISSEASFHPHNFFFGAHGTSHTEFGLYFNFSANNPVQISTTSTFEKVDQECYTSLKDDINEKYCLTWDSRSKVISIILEESRKTCFRGNLDRSLYPLLQVESSGGIRNCGILQVNNLVYTIYE